MSELLQEYTNLTHISLSNVSVYSLITIKHIRLLFKDSNFIYHTNDIYLTYCKDLRGRLRPKGRSSVTPRQHSPRTPASREECPRELFPSSSATRPATSCWPAAATDRSPLHRCSWRRCHHGDRRCRQLGNEYWRIKQSGGGNVSLTRLSSGEINS